MITIFCVLHQAPYQVFENGPYISICKIYSQLKKSINYSHFHSLNVEINGTGVVGT